MPAITQPRWGVFGQRYKSFAGKDGIPIVKRAPGPLHPEYRAPNCITVYDCYGNEMKYDAEYAPSYSSDETGEWALEEIEFYIKMPQESDTLPYGAQVIHGRDMWHISGVDRYGCDACLTCVRPILPCLTTMDVYTCHCPELCDEKPWKEIHGGITGYAYGVKSDLATLNDRTFVKDEAKVYFTQVSGFELKAGMFIEIDGPCRALRITGYSGTASIKRPEWVSVEEAENCCA